MSLKSMGHTQFVNQLYKSHGLEKTKHLIPSPKQSIGELMINGCFPANST